VFDASAVSHELLHELVDEERMLDACLSAIGSVILYSVLLRMALLPFWYCHGVINDGHGWFDACMPL
jgi:hypothetical protein